MNREDRVIIRSAALPVLCILTLLLPATLSAQEGRTPENLGNGVNSPQTDYVPVISPDENTLYFVRTGSPENTGGQSDSGDIWYSTRGANGVWTTARNIGPPLNTTGTNYVCSVTPDGNTLLLGMTYAPDGTTYPGVSISHRTATGWSAPEPITIQDFHNRANYAEYFLCNDGRTLLLCVERDDTYGHKDMYVSFALGRNEWSKPINLGATINTPASEVSPFLAADGVTLYFASDGHGGYGNTDIFVAKRLDDTWQNWSEPQNLGPGINTPEFDAYYTLPASGDFAYFVSTDNSFGAEDIFRIELPRAAKPDPVVLISGQVLNAKTRAPLDASIIYEVFPQGTEVGTARSDPRTGEYRIVLPGGARYGFRAEAAGYMAISDNIDATEVTEYGELRRDLTLVPIEVGQTIRLNNIFFDFARATLREESASELDRVVKFLEGNPSVAIEIAGHTDNVGSETTNLRLSQERAQAVVDYVTSHGIEPTRITAKGYGMTRPIAPNESEDGRQLNRRVEFTILRK